MDGHQPLPDSDEAAPVPVNSGPSPSFIICFFHMFFRGACLLLYLFGTWFSLNFILMVVLCILLLAADFWVVKNVTGRKLVGLRWWNEVKEDGNNVWRFESAKDTVKFNPLDTKVFWISLYAAMFLWVVFGLSVFFSLSFKWLLIVGVALALNGANVVGYTKCQKDARRRLTSFASQFLVNAAASSLLSGSNQAQPAAAGAPQSQV
eukprot:TRINITY_DN15706_c0_g1_i1.p1 TRINITY_DN15706_c0_g1~~TRINITY_DN15706_c0_g1_i1.p1  ORF type:complete len:206 (+),score=22.61 TRINITY_DN15706_c0_g1_i1:82-699(+)